MSTLDVDVLVYDSTPAGILAAIASARAGCSALVVTEDRHVGGMQTSGLGNTNAGQRATVGGMAREFYDRIQMDYVARYGADSEQVAVCQDGFHFESHVAERVYLQWMEEAGVECWTEDWIVSVDCRASRILSVSLHSGRVVRAGVFIDASYEGDLLKWTGCAYHLGRESMQVYGESLAGVRFPPSELGKEDQKIQGFDYRLCLTDVPENRLPFEEPQDYDSSRYFFNALQMRVQPPERLHEIVPLNMMPNRKTDSRTGEWTGGSWTYTEASRAEREDIARAHRNYSAGYLWFCLTDVSVPRSLREELSRWGLARDEFTDNDYWPYHLYVREARRLVGDFVMSQQDVTGRFQEDGVALGSFYLDVHPVELLAVSVPEWVSDSPDAAWPKRSYGMVAEGNLENVRVQPYEIPYRVLLPKRRDAQNLLVPVCSSASHVAFSTIRMEPCYQMLGHVAGVAAALSLEEKTPVQDVPVSHLRERLDVQGQILDAKLFPDFWP